MVLLVLLSAVPARAQSAQSQPPGPARPFRGLFGGNEADPRSRQALNLQASFFSAYDDNVLADRGQGGVPDPRYMTSGFYAGATTSLDYRRRWGRVSFDLSGGTLLRYYPSMSDFNSASEWASAGFSAALTRKTTLRASQGVSYSPFYSYGWFAGLNPTVTGEVVRPNSDYVVYKRPLFESTTAVDLARRVTRRSSLNFFYNLNRADFRQSADVSDPTLTEGYKTQNAGARFSYSATSRTSLRFGYSYQASRYGALVLRNQQIEGHNVEIGFEYARAFVRDRTTTFGVSTGGSVTDSPYNPYLINAANTSYYYNVPVDAYLEHPFGRAWNARLSYTRNLQFVEGLTEPFFSNAATATLRGYVGRRVYLTTSAAYSNGTGIYSSLGRGITAYTGTVQSQFALSRTTALFAQYFYYHYEIDGRLLAPPGPTQRFDRQGIRAGLSFWLPLLR